MYRKVILLILVLQSGYAVAADDTTLLKCSKIKDSAERVACYDKVANKVQQKLNTEYNGTAQERKQAKDESISNEVVGIQANKTEMTGSTITGVTWDRNRRPVYATSDGRFFRRSSDSHSSFSQGDEVHVKQGMFGSLFLIRSDGLKVKVDEIN